MKTKVIENDASPDNGESMESVAVQNLGLAIPADRPEADIVIFDGKCRFCQAQVKRLNWFDRGNRLAFLSLHDPQIQKVCPDLTHDQLMEQMFVVTKSGKKYGGAAAVRYLSRRLPSLWWLMPVMHIPFSLPLWQWLYMRVAIRRYRWGRDDDCTDACSIHLD